MSGGAQAAWLPDGRRLHLHHGPIDLIVGAEGPGRQACFARAVRRFETVLDELCAELPVLRAPAVPGALLGCVARRMERAVCAHRPAFVTPMAAVAGAVADAVLAAMLEGQAPRKAYVNNGGDIAFHLAETAEFSALGPAGPIRLRARDEARGLATSGWRGRSFSRGIADAVTVVANSAAAADVAATLIANAVDVPGHPAVRRMPANALSPDSDLGARAVTVEVGVLDPAERAAALLSGVRLAARMQSKGLICQAILCLQGQVETVREREALDA